MSLGNCMRAAIVAVTVVGVAAAVAQADECESMTKSVKDLIDRFDPTAKAGNNQARFCAAFAEGLGLMKSFRLVNDECLDEGEERTKILADLDRRIRTLQGEIDKNCE
jgi:hypothetical protein